MSQANAITVEGIGKYYRLGATLDLRRNFREMLMEMPGSAARKLRRGLNGAEDTGGFWALEDVSFEVKHGEAIGIIGRNGAGKSTLLKILSRITAPTKGRAELNGRVGSLLEVGTGFHPELSGRENIYLNGSILGMRKSEIDRKFDEIVDFAGTEKFLDTPVKRYSSGMRVRLGFAVAAYLEPEILVVDEVLSVGDAEFQRKCLGKMNDIATGGRTVLFVSHNMAAVDRLCSRVILLDRGSIVEDGSSHIAIRSYLTKYTKSGAKVKFDDSKSNGRVAFRQIDLLDKENNLTKEFDVKDPIRVELEFEARETVRNVDIRIIINNIQGVPVSCSHYSETYDGDMPTFEKGVHRISLTIPSPFLIPNTYQLTIQAVVPHVVSEDLYENVVQFTVMETGSSLSKYPQPWRIATAITNFHWEKSSGDAESLS